MKAGYQHWKRAFCLLLALVISLAGVCQAEVWADVPSVSESKARNLPENPVYHPETDTTDWSYVYFGSFPQREVCGEQLTEEIVNAAYDQNGDAVVNGVKYRRMDKFDATYVSQAQAESFYQWNNKEYAYFRYEPIRWRVLQNDGKTLFLMADQVLSCQPYQRDDHTVTWEISFAREWLNGNSILEEDGLNFKSMAFCEQEQAAICATKVTASDNPLHGISGGKDTTDDVFLLSIRELLSPKYGFSADCSKLSSTRRLSPTDYAFAMGTWLGTYDEQYYGNCWWLLRSPGSHQKAVSVVYPYGYVYQDGYYTNERYYGICPALRISLDSPCWSTEYPMPVYGDLDGDAAVTLEDARSILYYALRLRAPGKDTLLYADGNGDGQLTLADVRLALRCSLRIIEQLPVAEGKEPLLPQEREPYGYRHDALVYPDPKKNEASGTIWIAADSIAAAHRKSGAQPLYGWGELLGGYFDDSAVTVQNQAVSGSSARSFLQEKSYTNIMKGLSPGDYLLISFGHNDERCALSLYDSPYGDTSVRMSYKWYLKKYYIDPALEKGATPVLISPVVRRYYYEGQFMDPQLHAAYGKAMQELCEEYQEQGISLLFFDLHQYTRNLYLTLGEEGTKRLHGLSSGENYDNTHYCREGATKACEFIIQCMKDNGLDICRYLNESR